MFITVFMSAWKYGNWWISVVYRILSCYWSYMSRLFQNKIAFKKPSIIKKYSYQTFTISYTTAHLILIFILFHHFTIFSVYKSFSKFYFYFFLFISFLFLSFSYFYIFLYSYYITGFINNKRRYKVSFWNHNLCCDIIKEVIETIKRREF